MAEKYFAIVVFEGDGTPGERKKFEDAVISVMKAIPTAPVAASVYTSEDIPLVHEHLVQEFEVLAKESGRCR